MVDNRNMNLGLSALVVSFLISTGCASGPAFVAPEPASSDQAQVYVYRQSKVLGGAATHWVAVDGAANPPWLANGAYLHFRLNPGRHTITMTRRFEPLRCGSDPLMLDLKPGQTVYVEADVDGRASGAYPNAAGSPITIMQWSCGMTPRNESDALPAITGLKRMD